MRLLVSEIFSSVQGESTRVGLPCTFVRLSGCNLRCRFCDTPYAQEGGEEIELDAVLDRVGGCGLPLVEVTGGEPLVQKETPVLLSRLIGEGYSVMMETNGSLSVEEVDPRVMLVMDIKAPGSGEADSFHLPNLEFLKEGDNIKVVLANRQDYIWASSMIHRHRLTRRCEVLLSPAFGVLDPGKLVQWILDDRLPVRLNLQVHKFIWPPATRGV